MANPLATGTLASAAAAQFPLAKGPAIHSLTAKIGLYRECLLLAKTVRDPITRKMSIAEVQQKWREHRGHGGMSLEMTVASCLDRVSYLRMCTSKASQRHIKAASETYDWGVQNPMDNHSEMMARRERSRKRDEIDMPDNSGHSENPGRGKSRDFVPKGNWGQGNMDPDAIKKHVELKDRQYFMGPHWRGKPKPLIYEDLSFEEQMQAHFSPTPMAPKRVRKKY